MSLRRILPTLFAVAATATVPSAAVAATAPTVNTGGAGAVTQSSATLTGAVNPQGSATVYFFQYGPTTAYGTQTPDVGVGNGKSAKTATSPIGALAPATKYHYRVVARSTAGTTRGKDRTFVTKKQPLGLTLSSAPGEVVFGGGAVLNGNLSGTGNANQTVIFQQKGFPYTAAFTDVGNPLVTDQAGNFSLPLLSVGLTTQYRVRLSDKPGVVSPILTVPVRVLVTTRVNHHTVKRGSKVRFTGNVRPAGGHEVAIQKLRGTSWVNVGGTVTHSASASASRYRKSIKVNRSGTYRVFVGSDGAVISNIGGSVKIRAKRR